MKRILQILSVGLFAANTLLVGPYAKAADESERSLDLYKTPGMKFYSPQDFYSGALDNFVLDEIPENKVLSSENNAESKKLMTFLQGEGVAMGFGINPNRDSYFDLYGTVSVDVELAFPSPQFGQTLESEGGKRYFPDHDATHLWALRGVGPRLKDLKNRKEAINKWAKILMDAEALATAYSSAYQVREYWNWRFRQSGATTEEIQKFEAQNRGVMSLGKFTYRSYMDLVLSNVRGDVLGQYRLLRDNVSHEGYKEAERAQVPALFPPLSERIGERGEKFFFKYMLAPVAAITSYFRPKSGYFALMKGTKQLLEYYYSPSYVKWAEMFQIGEDLETATKNLEARMELFKNGNVFGDVKTPAPGRFEAQSMRNLITQQGRKLIELKELGAKDSKILTATDIADIDAELAKLVAENNRLIAAKEANTPFSPAALQDLRRDYLETNRRLEQRFPIETYIPSKYRLGYASYKDFWADPYAVVIEKEIVLSKFLSAKGVWKEALKLRIQAMTQNKKVDVPLEKPDLVGQLEKQLSFVYNFYRSEQTKGPFVKKYNADLRIQKFSETMKLHIEQFSEQVKEYQHLSWDERLEILEAAEKLDKKIETRVAALKVALADKRLVIRSEEANLELYRIDTELRHMSEKALTDMTKLLISLDYSALRALKSGVTSAAISAMMNKIVEGLGEAFNFGDIKTFDTNYKWIYKKHLKNLQAAGEAASANSLAQNARSFLFASHLLKGPTPTCSALTHQCLDVKFLEKVLETDMTRSGQGQARFNPIKEKMFDLLDDREQMIKNTCEGLF